MRLRDRICDTPERMLASELFLRVLKQYIATLSRKQSKLLGIFRNPRIITDEDIHLLVDSLQYLIKLPVELVPRVVPGSETFFVDKELFAEFIEQLYNYWRHLHRLIICDSIGDRFDKRPYRTFNGTLETLMHVVRSTYRDIQENVSGRHPRIYRQVAAGAQVGAIALPKNIPYPDSVYKKLNSISVIRQVLIYPPMIFNSRKNTRKGIFQRVYQNPVSNVDVTKDDWLCYPAKVGPLLIMVYFTVQCFEQGFALSNLFEVANDEDLKRKPDAVYLYGVPDTNAIQLSDSSDTIFYDDEENDILAATIPMRDEFDYFGYLKKMILTLHNVKMIKSGNMPFHGAMFNITVRDKGSFTVMIIGDTGAGKSESLEALRMIAQDDIEDIIIIADDMGSIKLGNDGKVLGYGTETGAFVRMDDLQPGYAFGQIDRAIIMNPNQVNARVVLPVTTYNEVMRGYPVDFVFYANNYDAVDEQHPTIERFSSAAEAIEVFQEGKVMSKGTTTSTGVVKSYFANIFGAPQYREQHDQLAQKFFQAFFDQGVFVGQFRTQLGVPGKEHSGPEEAARELLKLLKSM
jgi:energy-coupling factor transporter ATP-binding protein EcfA2